LLSADSVYNTVPTWRNTIPTSFFFWFYLVCLIVLLSYPRKMRRPRASLYGLRRIRLLDRGQRGLSFSCVMNAGLLFLADVWH
jgi:hypothetical protein